MNIQKLMQASKMKDEFVRNHPMMPKFFDKMKKVGIEENDIVELIVKKTDGEDYAANIKVKKSDIELLNELMQLRSK
jgi:hypothetical protein